MKTLSNITSVEYTINRQKRRERQKHDAFVLWFTGLSGAGKSTIANLVEEKLHQMGVATYALDGDNIRQGINRNLGFSATDREENLRRVAEIAKLMVDAGIVVLAAFISPTNENRAMIEEIIGKEDYIEVFIDTSLEECEKRDVKGLYKKARAGKISQFTGISVPYDAPIQPAIHIQTALETPAQAVEKILNFVQERLH